MYHLDLTLPTAAENLALDEALLMRAERAQCPGEVLRLWQSPTMAVVLGRSSDVDCEVDRKACRAHDVRVLRRPSGGASVVIGPGCLMYALVLSFERRPALQHVNEAHRFVLTRLADSLAQHVGGIVLAGTSDLAIKREGVLQKFSGNSLRVKRTHLLYHGTLLYDFPLPVIQSCLRTPPRQPDYRAQRSHDRFVTNLPLSEPALRRAVSEAFAADEPSIDPPLEEVAQLVRERYTEEV